MSLPKALGTFLKEVAKPQTVAVLYENTLFGQSGSKKFEKLCESMGIKVLMKEGYEHGAVDFKPLLIKVKSAQPDFVYMISYVMDAALLMRQSKELDFNPKMFVGGGAGFTLPEFAKNAAEASEDVYSADLWTPKVPYPGAQSTLKSIKQNSALLQSTRGAEAYASIYVVADALKRAKEPTPAAVREALVATDTMTAFGPVKFRCVPAREKQQKLASYLLGSMAKRNVGDSMAQECSHEALRISGSTVEQEVILFDFFGSRFWLSNRWTYFCKHWSRAS